MLYSILLQASEVAADAADMAQQPSPYGNLVFIVAIIAVFYFFMIRPQNKQRQKLAEERNAMKVGDNVVTSSGVYGKIDGINTVTDQKGKTQVESFVIKLKPDYNTRIVVYKDCVNKDVTTINQ